MNSFLKNLAIIKLLFMTYIKGIIINMEVLC